MVLQFWQQQINSLQVRVESIMEQWTFPNNGRTQSSRGHFTLLCYNSCECYSSNYCTMVIHDTTNNNSDCNGTTVNQGNASAIHIHEADQEHIQ